MKIKKGDQIKIISGNDKGKQGKVLSVFPSERRIIAEGINMKKKHVRPRSQGQKGELITMPAPFSVSRAMLICPKCGRPTRVGFKLSEVAKSRVCKKCGEEM
jgi:large subunit ribosomal protein L24